MIASLTENPVARAVSRHLVSSVAWMCYAFLVIPCLIVIPIAFGGGNELQFPPKTFSLDLFRRFFTDEGWWRGLTQSLLVAVSTTVLTLLLCIPAAFAIQRSSMRFTRVFSALTMGPLLVPVVVLGLGLYLQFGKWQMLNSTAALVLSHTMLAVPFAMVSITSGLAHIDPALETVALVMGASKPNIFFRVLLPQLKSAIIAGGFFAFLISFDEVVVAFFLTGPETQTLPVKMYAAIRWEVSPVIAAVSTLLTVLSLLGGLVLLKTEKSDEVGGTS
ncbi:ABC transporter permease [Paraburkholderia nemoris]|uniref:ABC transporter permease n=1 Tax=Paraburkholderia nemoris TaxID=2793076 RepID=UPI0038BDDF27